MTQPNVASTRAVEVSGTNQSGLDLRSVEIADVYKAEALAGYLRRTSEGITFSYTAQHLSNGGPPVALSLPLTPDPVVRPGGALPAFFEGLLPEGRRLGALRRQVKTSADDELSLLLAVGADTIGDVQIVPEGVSPVQVPPRVSISGDITEIRFSRLLDDLGVRPDLTAIPGVQDKASAAMLNVPISHRGSRYILKLTPPEYPFLVANEHCFLAAARLARIDTVDSHLVRDADGVDALMIRRFDRLTVAGRSVSVAVEDACQIAGLPPADKYRMTFEQVCAVLTQACQAPVVAARTLLTQLAFAYLTGNGDAHAKNFSILQTSRSGAMEWVPTPAYDVPSSQPYGDSSMALSVNGRLTDLGGRDFLALGQVLGLPERAVCKVLLAQADRVDAWLPLVGELPFDHGMLVKLERVIKHRRDRLLTLP